MEVTLISEKKATLIEVDGLVRISLGIHQHLYAYKVCIGDGVYPEDNVFLLESGFEGCKMEDFEVMDIDNMPNMLISGVRFYIGPNQYLIANVIKPYKN